MGEDLSKQVLDEAREAWEFHEKGLNWLKWLAVGYGLVECQRLALESTHSNDMTSNAARMMMSKILERERLHRIDKGDRSILLKVMAMLSDITAWRERLTTTERIRYNHPRSVWARYQKANVAPAPKDDGEAEQEPRGYKAQLAAAQTEVDQLKQQLKTEGSLFSLVTDTPEQIARAVLGEVVPSRAMKIAAAINKLAKEREKMRGHAG